jgi:uncharacterized protein
MALDSIVANRREEILRVARNHGVRDVRVFGSGARGERGASSDLDLLVTLEPGRSLMDLVAVKQDLEDLLGCKVDVVTENSLSPHMSPGVLKEAVTL